MFALTSACAAAAVALLNSPAAAQQVAPRRTHPLSNDDSAPIVVTGSRASAVTNVAPVATIDAQGISAIGATTMDDLLRVIRPMGESADGSPPIFLLNGQRTSGYQEISSLPPESIDKVEVLPEAAALKFGYPPTRRLLNFITRRNFRQTEVRATFGTTTDPGSTTRNADLSLTRLHNDSRLTVALERRWTSSLFQSERHIAPDPEILFDALGNVTGADGAEIDPALSAAAGQTVTVVPVPENPADRSSLDAYASAANQHRVFDIGPYRTLVPANDAWKAETVLADRLGGTLSGSINLTAEQSTDRTMYGPASATLTVPASNPYSPFTQTVLLQRYLVEADPLRSRQTTTTLHGGGTLRGVTAGWRWDLTAAMDQKLVSGTSEHGIDLTAANAAIAAGADPFVPLDASLLHDRLVDRSHLLTRTTGTKLVVTNTPVRLPAGELTVTGTVEAERQSASSVTVGADPFDMHLGRTRTEAGMALDVPLTSRREEVLPWAGDVSVNGSANVRRVTGVGTLTDHTLGLNWSPLEGVQLLIQDKSSGTAPAMEKLASPIVHSANVPLFDFVTGRTAIVTLTQGGNPDLAPEKKHVRSVALNLKPFADKDMHLSLTYEDSDTRDQTGDIYSVTPELEAAFPERFVRDSSRQLTAVTFQPINFYRRRQRTLHMTVSANGSVGRKPPDEPGGKKPQDSRPYYYAGAGPSIRFSDRLQLRAGSPELDLLGGDSVNGGGTPRLSGYFYGGIGYLGNQIGINGWYQASERVRSDNPTSDLFFSPLFKLNVSLGISVHHFTPKVGWTHHLQLKIGVDNVTDARVQVHDRNGDVPNRFQAELLDPIGRTAKLTLRKLF